MSNKKKKKKSGGATRGQIVLIGVLSAVLVGVIVVQLPGSSDKPIAASRKRPKRPRPATVAVINPQDTSGKEEEPRNWPEYSVSQLEEFDPLAPTDWYRQAVVVQSNSPDAAPVKQVVEQLELEKLQEAGANIVLIDGDHRIATVGEQRIRVGDKIDGYQVSEITDQGVVLTKSRSR